VEGDAGDDYPQQGPQDGLQPFGDVLVHDAVPPVPVHEFRDGDARYTAEFMLGSSSRMTTAKSATIRKALTTGNGRSRMPSDNGSMSRPPFP
jgi:hypothetical protein